MRIHRRISYAAAAASLMFVVSAFGHVRVSPAESAVGAAQRYTVRAPTERQSPTVRLELQVPAAATVTSIGATPGWKVEQQKDTQGKITGVVWSGGAIPFAEFAEFTFEAKNPVTAMKLEWKIIQTYEDGTRSEWTGPEGSRAPSSFTNVR